MYVARPEALRLLVEHEWSYDHFGGAEAYRDGGLAHILERMPSYAAGELGYHTRTVSTFEYMSISHTAFDFNFDQLSATIPGHTYEQIEFLKLAGYVGHGRARDFVRIYMRLHHPGTGAESAGRWNLTTAWALGTPAAESRHRAAQSADARHEAMSRRERFIQADIVPWLVRDTSGTLGHY